MSALFIQSLKQGVQVVRGIHTSVTMANSKWDYVKKFELPDTLLPDAWIVARIDGRGFHKLAKKHNWSRPNDLNGISLMNRAAKTVMEDFNDIVLSYGQSDEYSFVFRKETDVFERRESKLITTLVSKFSSAFVFYWSEFFPEVKLSYPPSFDGRIVLYPTDTHLKDYLCWRQADCHINNLYNTTFWALVLKGGLTNSDAQKRLSGTLSAHKHEILFSEFGINYNSEPEVFKKGTVLIQKERPKKLPRKAYLKEKSSNKNHVHEDSSDTDTDSSGHSNIIELNCDIIGEQFWIDHPHILSSLPEKISKGKSSISSS